jgi:hypothetical protein
MPGSQKFSKLTEQKKEEKVEKDQYPLLRYIQQLITKSVKINN